ncbi:MAG: methyltransferase type 12 [Alphaproteobacteria bacterium PA4]|nr:MAG: methyltransferase type 12 [Alphaproteobacteria bacterium PA4]
MKSIIDQAGHGALVKGGHDDRAAQDFAFTLRNFVTSELMPANRIVYDRRAGPRHARQTGAPATTPQQVRAAMGADSWYKFYVSARRTSQELIWSSVIPAVEAAAPAAAPASAGGTLTLAEDFVPPRYIAAIDIHCMPGGYCADRGPGDTAAGAVYDRGVYLYMSGLMGPMNDAVGQLAARWLKSRLPDFAPATILDLGCGVGHSTLAYAPAYPGAVLHGLDCGAALLRYGHARAESLGVPVHFQQGDAEHTPYADASFDLVTSHIVLHETSTRALPAILKECHRLLKPGGVMLHIDQPRFDDSDPYATFLQENETYYNNEPFWRQYRRIDLAAVAEAAGFAADAIETDVLTAAVVQQSQNNEKVAAESAAARKRGFSVLLARKSA